MTAGRLQGRRVVVSGGGSGIGRAASLRLAQEGARVAVLDKRGALAEAVSEEIGSAGGEALGIECDVGAEEQVTDAVARASQSLGGVDSLFANAGTAGAGWIHETTLADWESVLRVNLTGVFLLAKHCIPLMLEAGQGAVVTTGSIASGGGGGRRLSGQLRGQQGWCFATDSADRGGLWCPGHPGQLCLPRSRENFARRSQP